MKSVLISIKPRWCELIASGEKTVEVRKTRPRINTPFKCYIYCTKPKHIYEDIISAPTTKDGYLYAGGKVIGEFVCDVIGDFKVFDNGSVQGWNYYNLEQSCLAYEEVTDYIGKGKKGYAWHISDLVIYDKPKELSEFRKPCDFASDCFMCKRYSPEMYCADKLTRPPQRWCYVEELPDE